MATGMPDPEIAQRINAANGFLRTTLDSMHGEFQLRNAVSRSYYALFHACNAWLALKEVRDDERTKHGNLQRTIGYHRGAASKQKLRRFYVLRERADYVPAHWEPQDLEIAAEAVRAMSLEVVEYLYLAEIEAIAEQTRGES